MDLKDEVGSRSNRVVRAIVESHAQTSAFSSLQIQNKRFQATREDPPSLLAANVTPAINAIPRWPGLSYSVRAGTDS